ncbi:T9SS type A sorting domain-containing protein [Hymenobacter guriensis]|uniref:T9SS type A sorting domain-containing protein n=1 Tax=Hymenobacter guriensis TaxID=2793065 RepID=A0ABS0KXG3_9BACT|nr:T9SS type A sorting domain-containing protein [Hymenobacter guriensis]MBG8552501.1 T9SS type A sorting domain-containing protein [Hymenobacter guriensis]
MKTLRLFLLAAVCGLAATTAQAQHKAQAYLRRALPAALHSAVQLPTRTPWHEKQAVQAKTTVYRPGQSVTYAWNEEEEKWEDAQMAAFTYDAQARPSQIVYSDSVSKTPLMRQGYTFDGQGRPSILKIEVWLGTKWSNASQLLFGYDAHGDLISFATEDWVGTAWVPAQSSRFIITRNAQGLKQEVVEEESKNNGPYTKATREVYTVSNGRYTDVTYQFWNKTAWVNESRERNFTWANWATLTPASYEEQEWENNAWKDVFRHTFTYAGNGGSTETLQIRENNAWVNDSQESFLFDSFGNEAGQREEFWNGTAWETSSETRQVLTYGPNNRVLRSVEQDLDLSDDSFDNTSRTNHSAFQSFVITASRPATRTHSGSVYPNPATESVTLAVSGLRQTAPMQTELLNSLGQVVRTLTLQPHQGSIRQQVDVQGLQAGLYTLRLHTTEGPLAYPLIKR